jgi:CelD/BcsL family acetyltransferase involved in cellulose biosynthesis
MIVSTTEFCDLPNSATRDELTINVFETLDELSAAREEWDKFVERSGSDIYFTFDWLETWWKYYAGNRLLRCFLIRVNGRPIAALPFCIQKLYVGPISIVMAKFVGTDSVISVFTPAVERSRETEIWSTVLHWLLVKERLDAVSLSPLSGASSVPDAIRRVANRDPDFQIVRDDSAGPHTLLFLPASINEFLSTLTAKARSNNRRDLRKLNETANITFRTWRGEDTVGRFSAFVELHQRQWQARGKQGHFRDWPSSLSFNLEVVSKLAKKGRVRLHEILGDSELLAAEYSLILGDRCYWRLPARRDARQTVGLGRLALVMTIEALIDEGVHLIEAGPAHYNYKLEHGGKEFPLRRLVLARSSSPARSKTKLVLLWSDLIHLLYYRVWFSKIAPLIHRKRRPLSRLWIMTRL